MFPFGGVEVMLLGALLAGGLAVAVAAALTPRVGRLHAVVVCALGWSLVVLALVTLIPAYGAPGIVPADERLDSCSWDVGGPAPDGFWIFSGGQRLLNLAVFVPPGALLVLASARWPRSAVVTVPIGLVLLVGYSVAIELTQLALARLDRACDVTDVVDNMSGAVLGVLVGIGLALVVRPWRHR